MRLWGAAFEVAACDKEVWAAEAARHISGVAASEYQYRRLWTARQHMDVNLVARIDGLPRTSKTCKTCGGTSVSRWASEGAVP